MTTKKQLYAQARSALARVKDGEKAKWELAEAMSKLYEMGEKQYDIAQELGCAQTTVSNYLAAWRHYGKVEEKPTFSEAMVQIKPIHRDANSRRVVIPRDLKSKAEFVANLLKDKEVADEPVVRAVQERHTDRRLRQNTAAFNKEHGIPTRTEVKQEGRRLSVIQNDMFWRQSIATMQSATRAINDSISEVDRTGLPRSISGDLIREARTLARAAGRLEESAKQAALGNAVKN